VSSVVVRRPHPHPRSARTYRERFVTERGVMTDSDYETDDGMYLDVDESGRETCWVCHQEMYSTQELYGLSCNDNFHFDCIKDYRQSGSCPACRGVWTQDDKDDFDFYVERRR
jgi:hypothetical protein